MKIIKSFVSLTVFLFTGSAVADTITYTVDNIAGNTWQYNYTVANTGSTGGDILEFTVWFDLGLFENLAVSASPGAWDGIAIQPDPGLPDDGFADWLDLDFFGIAEGDVLGGFSVMFDFLGTGTPGSQFFDIVDPDTFDVLFSGVTELGDVVVPVSAPASASLFALGLLLIAFSIRRRRASIQLLRK